MNLNFAERVRFLRYITLLSSGYFGREDTIRVEKDTSERRRTPPLKGQEFSLIS